MERMKLPKASGTFFAVLLLLLCGNVLWSQTEETVESIVPVEEEAVDLAQLPRQIYIFADFSAPVSEAESQTLQEVLFGNIYEESQAEVAEGSQNIDYPRDDKRKNIIAKTNGADSWVSLEIASEGTSYQVRTRLYDIREDLLIFDETLISEKGLNEIRTNLFRPLINIIREKLFPIQQELIVEEILKTEKQVAHRSIAVGTSLRIFSEHGVTLEGLQKPYDNYIFTDTNVLEIEVPQNTTYLLKAHKKGHFPIVKEVHINTEPVELSLLPEEPYPLLGLEIEHTVLNRISAAVTYMPIENTLATMGIGTSHFGFFHFDEKNPSPIPIWYIYPNDWHENVLSFFLDFKYLLGDPEDFFRFGVVTGMVINSMQIPQYNISTLHPLTGLGARLGYTLDFEAFGKHRFYISYVPEIYFINPFYNAGGEFDFINGEDDTGRTSVENSNLLPIGFGAIQLANLSFGFRFLF